METETCISPFNEEGISLSSICDSAKENFPQMPFSNLMLDVMVESAWCFEWETLLIKYEEPQTPMLNNESKKMECELAPRLTLYEIIRVAARFPSFDPEKIYLCWDNKKEHFFLRQPVK